MVIETDPKSSLTQGQSITITVPYTDTVNDVKQQLQDLHGMPKGTAKIMVDEVVLTNAKTVAFYNLTSSMILHLGAKARGGK